LWGMCAITFQPLSLRTQLFRLMHFYEFWSDLTCYQLFGL
jgi:hypothetical protein